MNKEIVFEMVSAKEVAGLTVQVITTLDAIQHDHVPVFDEVRINTEEHTVTVEYWISGAPCTTTVDYEGNVVYDYNDEEDYEGEKEEMEEVKEVKEMVFNPSVTMVSAYAMVRFLGIIEGNVDYVEDGLTVHLFGVTADKYATVARAAELCNMTRKPLPTHEEVKEEKTFSINKEKVAAVKDTVVEHAAIAGTTVVKAATVAAKATGFFAGAFGRACKVGYAALKDEYNKK